MANRDFEAERQWLLRLPPGPDTDRRQDEWERDPAVIEWRNPPPNRLQRDAPDYYDRPQ